MTYDEKTYINLRLAALFEDLVANYSEILSDDGESVNMVLTTEVLTKYVEFETRLKNFVAYFKTQAEIQEVFKKYDI